MDFNIPQEERTKAIRYCRTHLGGHWNIVRDSDISVAKLRGGLSNLLYRCKIDSKVINEQATVNGGHKKNETSDVLLRLYGPAYSETETQLEVFKKLTSCNLGPKLYCEFEEGRLEEYLPSNVLSWKQLRDDDISAVIAKKLASIHRLDLSYCFEKCKENWLLKQISECHDFLIELIRKQPSLENFSKSTKDIAIEFMTVIDFQSEIEFISNTLEKLDVALVFSHNDLHQNNILMLHENDGNEVDDRSTMNVLDINPKDSKKNEQKQPYKNLEHRIILIDYEFCSYNYRGFDLANHLTEWCFDYTGDEYPNFKLDKNMFPTDARQKQFLKHYAQELLKDKTGNCLDESESLSENDVNCLVDELFDELQPHFMASNLLWCLWAIRSAFTSNIRFGYLEMAKGKWDIYLMCKKRYEQSKEN